jgi:GNAT superfamily N-acetyltransferase
VSVTVRHWLEADISSVLPLMRELAVFEEYLDSFAVTETVLLEQGFNASPPNFYVLVAELGGQIVGNLVYYFLPFSASAKPMLFIKELFVSETARGSGAGKALMTHASSIALEKGCAGMKWTVANWNEPAQRFYESLGAKANPVWVEYSLDSSALEQLVAQP